jgi:hypothetical protein
MSSNNSELPEWVKVRILDKESIINELMYSEDERARDTIENLKQEIVGLQHFNDS